MNFDERKQELKKISLTYKGVGAVAYQLLDDFYLDQAIKKINERKTKTICKSIHPKGYLSGNEQFVDVLIEFIHFFLRDFTVVGSCATIYLSSAIEDKVPKFLLCKNYWGNNDFIPYYTFNIRQVLVENFYDNIKFIYNDFMDFFKSKGINKRMSLKNSNTVNILYNLLIEMVWCNKNQFDKVYLFNNYKIHIRELTEIHNTNKSEIEIINYVREDYYQKYERLIRNYDERIELVRDYLKLY